MRDEAKLYVTLRNEVAAGDTHSGGGIECRTLRAARMGQGQRFPSRSGFAARRECCNDVRKRNVLIRK